MLNCRQSKGNNSSLTEYTLMKLHVHKHIMVIYIQFKFHDSPSITYKVMAEDSQNQRNLSNQRAIPKIKLHLHNHIMIFILSISFITIHLLVT